MPRLTPEEFEATVQEQGGMTAVIQRTLSQVSVLICFSFAELVRTTIVSFSPDTWNWRMRFLPTSAAASAPSRWCVTV